MNKTVDKALKELKEKIKSDAFQEGFKAGYDKAIKDIQRAKELINKE